MEGITVTRPAVPPRSIIHHITNRHTTFVRDGVGEIILCGLRFTSQLRLWFQPQLTGAGWHQIPLAKGRDDWMQILRAETPEQAMAILRHLQDRDASRRKEPA